LATDTFGDLHGANRLRHSIRLLPFHFDNAPFFQVSYLFSLFSCLRRDFLNYAHSQIKKFLSRDIYSPEDEGKKPGRNMMQIPRFANLFATSNLPNFGIILGS
jgi:hypothetical protein